MDVYQIDYILHSLQKHFYDRFKRNKNPNSRLKDTFMLYMLLQNNRKKPNTLITIEKC